VIDGVDVQVTAYGRQTVPDRGVPDMGVVNHVTHYNVGGSNHISETATAKPKVVIFLQI